MSRSERSENSDGGRLRRSISSGDYSRKSDEYHQSRSNKSPSLSNLKSQTYDRHFFQTKPTTRETNSRIGSTDDRLERTWTRSAEDEDDCHSAESHRSLPASSLVFQIAQAGKRFDPSKGNPNVNLNSKPPKARDYNYLNQSCSSKGSSIVDSIDPLLLLNVSDNNNDRPVSRVRCRLENKKLSMEENIPRDLRGKDGKLSSSLKTSPDQNNNKQPRPEDEYQTPSWGRDRLRLINKGAHNHHQSLQTAPVSVENAVGSRALKLSSDSKTIYDQLHSQYDGKVTQAIPHPTKKPIPTPSYRQSQAADDLNDRRRSSDLVQPALGPGTIDHGDVTQEIYSPNPEILSPDGDGDEEDQNLPDDQKDSQIYDHIRLEKYSSRSLHHPTLQRQNFQPHPQPRPLQSSKSEDYSHENYDHAPSSPSRDNSSGSRVTSTTINNRGNHLNWAPMPVIPMEASEPNPKHFPDWKSLRNYPEKLTSNPISRIREDFDYSLRKLITENVFEEILDDNLARYRFRDWLNKNQMNSAISKVDLWLDSRAFSRLVDFLRKGATGINEIYLNPSSDGLVKIDEQIKKEIFNSFQKFKNTETQKVLKGLEKEMLRSLFHNEFQSFLKHLVVSQAHVKLGKFNLSEADGDGLGDCFCLTNPRMRDHPIVLVSEGFTQVTGYDKKEVIGRNCRFLQGPGTAPQSVQRIRDGLNSGEGCTELILNYRRNGTPFYCLLCIIPLRDSNGSLAYFIGGQINVTGMFASKKGLSFLFGEPDAEYTKLVSGMAGNDYRLDQLGTGNFQISPSMQRYFSPEGNDKEASSRLVLPGEGLAAGSISQASGSKELVGSNDPEVGFTKNMFDNTNSNQLGGGGGFFRRFLTGKSKDNSKRSGLKFGGDGLLKEQRLAGAEAQMREPKLLEDQFKVFESTYSKIIIFKRENREIIFVTRPVLKLLNLPDSNPKEIYGSNLIHKDFIQLIWSSPVINSNNNNILSGKWNSPTNQLRDRIKKVVKMGSLMSLDCQIKASEQNSFLISREEKLVKMKQVKVHLTPLKERNGGVVAYICVLG